MACKVELVFDRFDLADVEVRYEGRGMGKVVRDQDGDDAIAEALDAIPSHGVQA